MKIAIVGGGAAGIMAAIVVSKCSEHEIVIYERNDKLGKKLLMTGNGKCNFSNVIMDSNCFQNENKDFVLNIISQFNSSSMINFLNSTGILTKEKKGYLYPFTEQASTLVEIFSYLLKEAGVLINYNTKINGITRDKNSQQFLLKKDKGIDNADVVIIATGGMAAPKTGSDGSGIRFASQFGHTITPLVPALVQLKTKETYIKHISGVRIHSTVTLFIDQVMIKTETGELQIRDFGLSGIVIFQVSRYAAYGCLEGKKVMVKIDMLSDFDEQYLIKFIYQLIKKYPHRLCGELFVGIIPKKIMLLVLKLCKIKEEMLVLNLTNKQIKQIVHQCKAWEFNIVEPNSFEHAQISAGGVKIEELTNECQSLLVPNLYFVGEVVDVDGICGGYNLQWAWSSGFVVGNAIRT